ncbi:GNAT family N-acetyltransferase [Sinorhizobium meliloti]|uniref:GNAT family N-acetyltransferase n=1 Tax=Rhizobium meliloti TaxID=382 RepID=UPI003F136492
MSAAAAPAPIAGRTQAEAVEVSAGKSEICREIMAELSDWFTEPAVIEACAKAVETLPMFAYMDGGSAAGFVALKEHPPAATEILVIASRRHYHSRGVGKTLLTAAEQFARARGSRLLTVKTLAPRGRDEPQYEATRAFYHRNGFIPAEIFPTLWHEDHPCLFLVKPL